MTETKLDLLRCIRDIRELEDMRYSGILVTFARLKGSQASYYLNLLKYKSKLWRQFRKESGLLEYLKLKYKLL